MIKKREIRTRYLSYNPGLRRSERSDEALSKRLFTKCSDPVFPAYSLLLRADRHSWLEADICGW